MMRLGTASRDITPPVGAELSGYLFRVQPSVGVHDALFARALFIECDGERLLWLHADVIGFTGAFVHSMRRQLSDRLGLRPGQIVISATHTHAGPATVPLILCGESVGGGVQRGTLAGAKGSIGSSNGLAGDDYLRRLADELESASAEAMRATEAVTMVAAEGRCDLAIDRRKAASAHTDPRVGVIAWRRADGRDAAVLANYAMHNVALSHDNRQISGDVAGAAARHIAGALPGRPTVLFTAGAAANVNPPASSTDFAQVDAWGELLAKVVIDALSNAHSIDQSALRIDSATVRVPYQRLDAARIEAIARGVAGALLDDGSFGRHRYHQAVAIWRDRMLSGRRDGALPDAEDIELQRISFGGVDLLCINAEIFSRFGDDLRASLGRAPLYVIGYANGVIGYVAPAQAYDEGGYETDSAFVFYGGLPLERGAYERISDRAGLLLASDDSRALEPVTE